MAGCVWESELSSAQPQQHAIYCTFIDKTCAFLYFETKLSNILHIMDEFFKSLQKRRESLGLSQRDLSEMSGVSLRTINAIENGGANPSIEVLYKLAEQLGLKLSLTERVVNG